jgi:hypothetical protein
MSVVITKQLGMSTGEARLLPWSHVESSLSLLWTGVQPSRRRGTILEL